MTAVVEFFEDVVGGAVEAVGNVVEGVVDVVKDVGQAVDKYVIQPILDDPLTAIATMAGAAILGPAIAPSLGALGGASSYVATGLGAAAGNTAAGLAQGEDFDEAIKGGVMAGITSGAGAAGFDYLTGGGAFSPTAAAATPDEALAAAAATPDTYYTPRPAPSNQLADALVPDTYYPPTGSTLTGTKDIPLGFDASSSGVTAINTAADDFLTSMGDDILASPTMTKGAAATNLNQTFPLTEVPKNYLLEGVKLPGEGLTAPTISKDLPLSYTGGTTSSYGLQPNKINYDLMAGVPDTTTGIQPGTGPVGMKVGVNALDDFAYADGTPDVWTGTGGKTYGMGTPEGTVSASGFAPNQPPIVPPTSAATTAAAEGTTKTLGDKLKNFEFSDINMTDIGKAAMNYAVENPLTTLAAVALAGGALSGVDQPPGGDGAPSPGSTRDENFDRPLDYYNYLRDQQAYGGDLTSYGERPGEHRFFLNTRFEPVPVQSKTGGLIQYKQRYADGGIAGPQIGMPQTPQNAMSQREAVMAAMQQRAAMAKRQGALAQMQGGMPMTAPQGMSGMMPQQPQPARQGPINRNPKTAYYQYGTPPGMAAGGLNMVRSMNVGGGADGRSDDVDALLSDGEYVIDAETVAMLGNGSSEAGASRLDQMRSSIRKHKGKNLSQGKISPDAKSPLAYLKGA